MARLVKFLVRVRALAKRELISFFVSPLAYFIVGALTFVSFYFFLVYLEYFNLFLIQSRGSLLYGGDSGLSLNQLIEGYFRVHLLIFVFVLPILAMKLFAEERRAGVFEFLLTSPINSEALVLGKFLGFGVFLTALVLWVSILPMSLVFYGDYEIPVLLSNMLGFWFFTIALGSIAMLVSCLVESVIVGGIVSMVVLLLLYVLNFVVSAVEEAKMPIFVKIIQYTSPLEQVDGFMKGVVGLESIIYFLSVIFLSFVFTVRAVDTKRLTRF